MAEVRGKRATPFATVVAIALVFASNARAQAPAPAPAPGPAASAGSDDDPDIAKAREHFNRAQQLYDEGHFEASLLELQRAYELKPSWRMLFNIAELRFAVHDYVGSLRAFERFLSEGGEQVESAKRAAADSKLVTLRNLVGQLTVTSNVEGATVWLDDEEIGKTPLPKVAVNVGRHKVTARREGYLVLSVTASVHGNEESKVDLTLVRLTPFGTKEPAQAPSRFTVLSWVGIGVASAFAVGSIAMFAAYAGANSDLKRITYVGSTPSQEYTDKDAEVSRDRTLGIVFAAASAATLGATLYFTLSRTPKASARPVSSLGLALTPGGAFLDGRFP